MVFPKKTKMRKALFNIINYILIISLSAQSILLAQDSISLFSKTDTVAPQSLFQYLKKKGPEDITLFETLHVWKRLLNIQNVIEKSDITDISNLQRAITRAESGIEVNRSIFDIGGCILNGEKDGENNIYYLDARIVGPDRKLVRQRIYFFKKNIQLSKGFRERIGIGDNKKRIQYAGERGFWIVNNNLINTAEKDLNNEALVEDRVERSNISCGTICESGHEGSYGALDSQLERQFEELRKIFEQSSVVGRQSSVRSDEKTIDLTEDEADRALVEYAKSFSIDVTFEQLQEYRRKIKEADEALNAINIFFSIPETGTELFWIGEDYAGGHFNKAGTRIHISLPLILSQPNPKQAALAIVKHEMMHVDLVKGRREKITQEEHEDSGMVMVRKTALKEIKSRTISDVSGNLKKVRYKNDDKKRELLSGKDIAEMVFGTRDLYIQNNRKASRKFTCSGRCAYCFARTKHAIKRLKVTQPMECENITAIVSNVIEMGFNRITLGGEDTLDDMESFWAVIDACKEKNVDIVILTNGIELLKLPDCGEGFFKQLENKLSGHKGTVTFQITLHIENIGRIARKNGLKDEGEIYERYARVIKNFRKISNPEDVNRKYLLFLKYLTGVNGHYIKAEGCLRNALEYIGFHGKSEDMTSYSEVGPNTYGYVKYLQLHRSLKSSQTVIDNFNSLKKGMKDDEDQCDYAPRLDIATSEISNCPVQFAYPHIGIRVNNLETSLFELFSLPRSRHLYLGDGQNRKNEFIKQLGFALALKPELAMESGPTFKSIESRMFENEELMIDIEMLYLLEDLLHTAYDENKDEFTLDKVPVGILNTIIQDRILSAYLEFYAQYSNKTIRDQLRDVLELYKQDREKGIAVFKKKLSEHITPILTQMDISNTDNIKNGDVSGSGGNVSCGTICEKGHEGSYEALDEQLKRQFEELRKILGQSSIVGRQSSVRSDEKTIDLTEDEADRALVEYAKSFSIDVTFEQLQEYRRKIKEADEALNAINIFFSIPEVPSPKPSPQGGEVGVRGYTELFWVGEDYAGGHFNKAGTRIHISLPIILKRGIDAGIAIAKHELDHIQRKEYQDDRGMKLVREIAENDRQAVDSKIRFNISSDVENIKEAWKAVFEDEHNAREFFKLATSLRLKYPYNINKSDPRSPLEYALEEGIYEEIGQGLFVTPVSDSFRRHIVFKKDKDGGISFAFEVMIPGEYESRRNLDVEKRISISNDILQSYPEKEYCVSSLYVKEYPAGEYNFYGKQVKFSTEDPLRIIAFKYIEAGKYNNDGKRLEHVSAEMIAKIADLFGVSRRKLALNIARQVAEFTAAYHNLGYIGNDKEECRNDTHLGNIRFIVDKENRRVIIKSVADFGAFIKPSDEKVFDEGVELDLAYLIELEYEIPNLQDILKLSKRELYSLFRKAQKKVVPKLKPAVENGDASSAIMQRFKDECSERILQRVREKKLYDEAAKRSGYDVSVVHKVVYNREMAFCLHIIGQTTRILNYAHSEMQKNGDKPPKIIQINTSMLYDIDETLGHVSPEWNIRPSVPVLFKFLKEHFNIKIGITTLRGYSAVQKQLQPGNTMSGSLEEIAEFIEPDMVFSVAEDSDSIKLTDNLYGEYNLIFPGFTIPDQKEILHSLGWDDIKIERLMNVIGPAIFKAKLRHNIMSWYPEEEIEKEVEEYYKDLLARPNNIVSEYLNAAYNANRFFVDFDNTLPDLDEKRKYAPRFWAELEKSGVTKEDVLSLVEMNEAYSNVIKQIRTSNGEKIEETTTKLKKLFRDATGKEASLIVNSLHRLASAKYLLDHGKAVVSVAIDNIYTAELFYKLFMGEIRDSDGRDGYAILDLEKYRGRLFLMSTSPRGEYVWRAIEEEYKGYVEKAYKDRIRDFVRSLSTQVDTASQDVIDIMFIRFLREQFKDGLEQNEWDDIKQRIAKARRLLDALLEILDEEKINNVFVSAIDNALRTAMCELSSDREIAIPKIVNDFEFLSDSQINVAVLQRCWESESYGVVNENAIGSSECNVFYIYPDWIYEREGELYANTVRFKDNNGDIIHARLKTPIRIDVVFNVEMTWNAEKVIKILKRAVTLKIPIIGDPHQVCLGRKDLFCNAFREGKVPAPETFVLPKEFSEEKFKEFREFALPLADESGMINLVLKPSFSGDGRGIEVVSFTKEGLLRSLDYSKHGMGFMTAYIGDRRLKDFVDRWYLGEYTEGFVIQKMIQSPKVKVDGKLRPFSLAVFTSKISENEYRAEPGILVLSGTDRSGLLSNISRGGKMITLEYLFDNLYGADGIRIEVAQTERGVLIKQIQSLSEQMCGSFEDWKYKNIETVRKLQADDEVFEGLMTEDRTKFGTRATDLLYSRNDIMFTFDKDGMLIPVAIELNSMPSNHLFAERYANGNSTLNLFKILPRVLNILPPEPAVTEIKQWPSDKIITAEKELVARFGYKGWNLLVAIALSREIGEFSVPDFEIIEIGKLWQPFYEENKELIDEIIRINQIKELFYQAIIDVYKKYTDYNERRQKLEEMLNNELSDMKKLMSISSISEIEDRLNRGFCLNKTDFGEFNYRRKEGLEQWFKELVRRRLYKINWRVLKTYLAENEDFIRRKEKVFLRTSSTDEDTKDHARAGKYVSGGRRYFAKDTFIQLQGFIIANLHRLTSKDARLAFVIQDVLEGDDLEGGVLFSDINGDTIMEFGYSWSRNEKPVKYNPLSEATGDGRTIIVRCGEDEIKEVLYNAVSPDEYGLSHCVNTEKTGKCTLMVSKEDISKIKKIAKEAERKLGYPIDIEFGIKNGRIFIVQIRPIVASATDLPELPKFNERDVIAEFPLSINVGLLKNAKVVFTNANVTSYKLRDVQKILGYDSRMIVCLTGGIRPEYLSPYVYGDKLFWIGSCIQRVAHEAINQMEENRHVICGYFGDMQELKGRFGPMQEIVVDSHSVFISEQNFDIYSNGDRAILVKAGVVPINQSVARSGPAAERVKIEYAKRFIPEVAKLSKDCEDMNQDLVIAIDTEIGNLKDYAGELFKALIGLQDVLRKKGFNNIRIFIGEGVSLKAQLDSYLQEAEREGKRYLISAVVKSDGLKHKLFENIKDKIQITAVDDTNLPNNAVGNLNYIPILQIIELSVKKVLGKYSEGDYSNLPNVESIIEEQGLLIIYLLPKSSPISIDELKDMYSRETQALTSA
jgi:hypothetical protein